MRKHRLFLVSLVSLYLPSTALAQAWTPPVREIARPGLPDVAMAGYDALGPVIYFNPQIVASLPRPLVLFFQAHEYGHHDRNHLRREAWEANPFTLVWVRQEYEREADCYAAQVLRDSAPEAIQSAIQFFTNYFGARQPDWYHPSGFDRAAVIRSCGTGPRSTTDVDEITVPCTHPVHPQGDCQPCNHPAHPYGDAYPCQHPCPGPYGPVHCHFNGDVGQCMHPLHPYGDCGPCVHPLHPGGDTRRVPRSR